MSATEPHSNRKVVGAIVIALFVAGMILAAFVLPAEYGVDPFGTGRLFGLMVLSEASATPIVGTPAASAVYKSESEVLKSDSRDIMLAPGEGIEIKYHMAKDSVLVYSWTSTETVLFEFHGEPDVKPDPKYYDSYELDDSVGKTEGHGSFVAPSTGIHGWYWENKNSKTITIHLTAAGFFDGIKQMNASGIEEFPAEDAQ